MFSDISRRQLLRAGASLGAAGAMGAAGMPGCARRAPTGRLRHLGQSRRGSRLPAYHRGLQGGRAGRDRQSGNRPGRPAVSAAGYPAGGPPRPDLCASSTSRSAAMPSRAGMLDLGPMPKPGYMDDFADVHRSALTFGGKQFAMPFDNNTACHLLRQGSDGGDVGEVPPTTIDKAWTWADLERIAAAIVDKKATLPIRWQ